MDQEFTIRYAERKDTGLILKFIKELAKYEKMEQEVVATEELLEEWIFDKQKAEVIFGMEDGQEIGLLYSSTTFLHSLEERDSIWKIYTFCLNSGARVMARRF